MNLAPIILFCYNRPWHVEQTLIALSKNELANQSVLYIYCDGPKENATEEQINNIKKTREVVKKEKWCKEVHIIEAEKNKGLADSIIGGVTDVVNKYGSCIVLEDDLVSSPYFLKFMNNSLNFYKDYPSVFSVSANRPPLSKMQIPDDYQFDVFVCLRSYSTGWATWKDRWDRIDWSMDLFDKYKTNKSITEALSRLGDDFAPMMQMQEDGKIDSWAVRFGFMHFVHHAVAILPCNSYVTNIGFDGTGTHSGTVQSLYENDLSLCAVTPRMLDVIYEDKRIINAFYNVYTYTKRPLWKKIINRVRKLFGCKSSYLVKKRIYL